MAKDRIFKRKIYEQLLKWKQTSKGSSALLVQGARRIGKSTIVEEFARKECAEKPTAIVGRSYAQWVAMDYGTVMVHVFLPEAREHYDLENLWEYREMREIPNDF